MNAEALERDIACVEHAADVDGCPQSLAEAVGAVAAAARAHLRALQSDPGEDLAALEQHIDPGDDTCECPLVVGVNEAFSGGKEALATIEAHLREVRRWLVARSAGAIRDSPLCR